MYQQNTHNINQAYYENDPYNFEEIIIQHDTHKSMYNPQKHNIVYAKPLQEVHRPVHPAREVSEMHDYSEEAKQVLRIFKSLEPSLPDTEEEYLSRYRSVAPEVFEGMEQQQRNKIRDGTDEDLEDKAKAKRNLIFSSIGGEQMKKVLRQKYTSPQNNTKDEKVKSKIYDFAPDNHRNNNFR
jgi:hypothetical protein